MELVSATGALSPWTPGIFSLTIYVVVVLTLIGLLLFITTWLGDKRPHAEKQRPYESGIIPTGSARLRFPIPFYLVAIFFLIFDVEGVYILSWAVAAQDLGWPGLLRMSFFIFVLLLGLVYIWRKEGLEWGPSASRK